MKIDALLEFMFIGDFWQIRGLVFGSVVKLGFIPRFCRNLLVVESQIPTLSQKLHPEIWIEAVARLLKVAHGWISMKSQSVGTRKISCSYNLPFAHAIVSGSMKSQSVDTRKISFSGHLPIACLTDSESMKSQSVGTRKISCSDHLPIACLIDSESMKSHHGQYQFFS